MNVDVELEWVVLGKSRLEFSLRIMCQIVVEKLIREQFIERLQFPLNFTRGLDITIRQSIFDELEKQVRQECEMSN